MKKLFFFLLAGLFASMISCTKDDPVTPTPPPPDPVKPKVTVNFSFPVGVYSVDAACSIWTIDQRDLIEGRQMVFPYNQTVFELPAEWTGKAVGVFYGSALFKDGQQINGCSIWTEIPVVKKENVVDLKIVPASK